MSQRTHVYEVQKGDKVLPQFVGTKVELVDFTTPEEALANGHFENIGAIMSAAYRDRHIISNRAVRTALSKLGEGETPAQAIARAVKAGNAVKVGAASERKTPATAKPETRVKRQAQDAGQRIFEKMAGDATFRQTMLSSGAVDQGTYDAWVKAREAAKAGNGAATPQAQAPATEPTPAGARRPAGAGGGKR